MIWLPSEEGYFGAYIQGPSSGSMLGILLYFLGYGIPFTYVNRMLFSSWGNVG